MPVCPECGATFDSGAESCPKCGWQPKDMGWKGFALLMVSVVGSIAVIGSVASLPIYLWLRVVLLFALVPLTLVSFINGPKGVDYMADLRN